MPQLIVVKNSKPGRGLLNLPVLYLSRYIIGATARDRRRGVARPGLFMLYAVEQTPMRTQRQITEILALMESVRQRVLRQAPSIHSKDLSEQIFKQPYCKIQFPERACMGTRQTFAKWVGPFNAFFVFRQPFVQFGVAQALRRSAFSSLGLLFSKTAL